MFFFSNTWNSYFHFHVIFCTFPDTFKHCFIFKWTALKDENKKQKFLNVLNAFVYIKWLSLNWILLFHWHLWWFLKCAPVSKIWQATVSVSGLVFCCCCCFWFAFCKKCLETSQPVCLLMNSYCFTHLYNFIVLATGENHLIFHLRHSPVLLSCKLIMCSLKPCEQAQQNFRRMPSASLLVSATLNLLPAF